MAGKIQSVLYNVAQTETSESERQQAQRNILGDLSSRAGEYLKVNETGDGLDFGEGGAGARIIALGEGGTLEQYNLIKSYIDNGENVILYSTAGNNRVYWTYSGNIGGSLLFSSYQGTKLGRLSYYTRSTTSGGSYGDYQITYENAVKAYNSVSVSGTEILEAYADGQGQIPVVYENTYGTARMIYTFSGITGDTEPMFSRVDEMNKQLVILTYKSTGLDRKTIPLSHNVIISIAAAHLDSETTAYSDIADIFDAGFSPVVHLYGGYNGDTTGDIYHLTYRRLNTREAPPTFEFDFEHTEYHDNYSGDQVGYAEKSVLVYTLVCKGNTRDGGTWKKTEHRPVMVLNGNKMGVSGKLPDYTSMKAFITAGTEVILKYTDYSTRYIFRPCVDSDYGVIFAAATTQPNNDLPRLYRIKLSSDNVWSKLDPLDIGGDSGGSVNPAGTTQIPVYVDSNGTVQSCGFGISTEVTGNATGIIYFR